MTLLSRITVNPNILFGKPSIRNKRYPVTMVLDLLSAGMTFEELLEDYEDLELEDICVFAICSSTYRSKKYY